MVNAVLKSLKCISDGCNVQMSHRTGKFGGFWFCPIHGTVSDKGVAIYKVLKARTKQQGTSGTLCSWSESSTDPLGDAIARDTSFGLVGGLERWIVDGEPEDDEEDHWKNTPMR
jgi:hypothetical protein